MIRAPLRSVSLALRQPLTAHNRAAPAVKREAGRLELVAGLLRLSKASVSAAAFSLGNQRQPGTIR